MPRPRLRVYRPHLESLDDRCLLAASALDPAQVAAAYGLSNLSFGGQAANGSGQTIAIVDAYNDPNIQAELGTFDATNNLPAPPSLSVIGENGTQSLPRTSSGWAQEEALDVEWAHALAPGASIILVETNSFGTSDLMAGVKTAAAQPGVSVVSMSWGGSEDPRQTTYDSTFSASGITFVAASGDEGPGGGAQWPASSPNVIGVGGTTLQVADGSYESETPWADSSGGYSTVETEPSYQQTAQSSGWRSTPDVAFDADPNTGVGVYAMDPFSGQGSWLTVGGTSLGAPAWAAIVAVADQGRALNSTGRLSSYQTLSALYGLPSSAFHVVGGGYNTQTGLGTPNGGALVNGLVAFDSSTTTSPTSTPTPTPAPTSTPTPTPAPTSTWPVINLPVSATPISTPPSSTPPVATTPVTTTPVPITTVTSPSPTPTPTPVTLGQSLTPPPAAPPVSVAKVTKKKAVSKHPTHHPKPLPKHHATVTEAKHKAER